MEEETPNYYAVIPAKIRYDNKLSASEKLMFGEITALTQKTGKCWAKNRYFSELYGVSQKTISSWIKKLVECGYVTSCITYKKGTNEIEGRYLQICGETYPQKCTYPTEENVIDNNTSINNTSINNKEIIIKKNWKYFDSPKLDEAFTDYVEMRKKIKAPMTEKAIKLAINKLFELSNGSEEMMVEIINQSVMNSWKGLFPLKQEKQTSKIDWEAIYGDGAIQ